jgi:exopolysaccharide production protein ExoZ
VNKIAGKNVLNNLQGLRGIAALMVCFYHLSAVIPEGFLRDFLKQGIIGVQVFFMISGFIMVHTTKNISNNSIAETGRFLLRRILRIAPLYFIATFLYIADDLNNNGYLQENISKLMKSFAFIPQMTDENGPYYGVPVLEVGWSLNYEMLFYLILGISILFKKIKNFIVIGFITFVVFILPFFAGSHFTFDYAIFHDFNFSYLNFASNPIMIHFIFGMMAAQAMPLLKIPEYASKILMLVAVMLFTIYYSGYFHLEINALNDLVFCGLLFVAFLENDFRNNGVKINSAIVKIGDSSYSLYLFHVIIFVYLKLLFVKTSCSEYINTIGFFVFASIVCVTCSYVIYLHLEKKMHVKLLTLIYRKKR